MSTLIIILASLALAVVSYKTGYESAINTTKKWGTENFNHYYTKGHHDCIDSFVACGIMKKATGERLKKRFERTIFKGEK